MYSQEIDKLRAQINHLRNQIAGLSAAANQRATETYERGVREKIVRDLIPIYGQDLGLTKATERLVRYIVDGPAE